MQDRRLSVFRITFRNHEPDALNPYELHYYVITETWKEAITEADRLFGVDVRKVEQINKVHEPVRLLTPNP